MNNSNLSDNTMRENKINKNHECFSKLLWNWCKNKFKLGISIKKKADEKQLAFIAENLAQIYKAGIPITDAIELIIDISPNKTYVNSLYKVLLSIKAGNSLSEAFAQFSDLYPEFFVGIISIGENTGKLYMVLKALSVFYSKTQYIKNEIKNASAYPAFILFSIIVLSIFLVSKVIPNFCEIYKSMNIPLPANCKWLYDMYVSLYSDPFIAFMNVVCVSLMLIIVLKVISKKINRDIFIKIPIVRAFFEYIMVLILSIIISTGINISKALGYCENSISFTYLKRKITGINSKIIRGSTLTEALDASGMFSKYSLAIIKIREESGLIDEGLKELSKDLEGKLLERIEKCLKRINPVFIFIMAGFIVTFILTFVVPLFDTLQRGIRR